MVQASFCLTWTNFISLVGHQRTSLRYFVRFGKVIHKKTFLIFGNYVTLIVTLFMEAAIGVMIIFGLLFCFLMWAQIIRFDRKAEVEIEVEDDDS